MIAAAYPGQAILTSKTIEVLELTGRELTKKGDFFALMFFILGLGALVVYFIIGRSTNVIAQASNVGNNYSPVAYPANTEVVEYQP